MATLRSVEHIDLTHDSDDSDDEGPLRDIIGPRRAEKPSQHYPQSILSSSNSSTSSSQKHTPVPLPVGTQDPWRGGKADKLARASLKNSPVLLPANVRNLQSHLGASSASGKASTPSPTASISHPTPPSSSSSAAQHNHGSPWTYFPVFGEADPGKGHAKGTMQHAEKRRKLFNGLASTSQALPQAESRRTSLHGKVSDAAKNVTSSTRGARDDDSRSQILSNSPLEPGGEVKQKSMGKGPSLQNLKAALKTNGKKEAASAASLARETRALHIGRLSSREYDSSAPSAKQGSTSSASAVPAPVKLPTVPLESRTLGNTRIRGASKTAGNILFSPKGRVEPPASTRLSATMLQQKKTVAELLHHAPAGFKPAATDSGVPQQHLEPRKHSPSLPKSSSHDSSAPNRFSEEEDHLLVFLKETKMKGWVEISRYFPNRKIHSLQSRYSQYLSKRDRMKDPPRVNLPPHIIAEAGLYHTGGEGFAHTPPPMKSKRDRPPHSSIGIIPDQVFQDQEDPSSSNDSVPRRGPVRPRARPRRAVQEVDYTWPRHGRRSGFDGEVLKDEELINGTSPSDEPDQEAPLGPELVIPIEQPIDVGFEREDARFALSLAQAPTASHQLPYLSSSQRSLARNGPQAGEWDLLVGRDWQSSTIHVDFTHDEMKAVELAICKVMLTTPFSNTGSRRKWIQKHLKGQPEHKLAKLCDKIRTRLPARESESVKAFLHDAQIGLLHSAPRVERLGAVRPNRKFSSAPRISTSSLIRQRELGLHSRRGWASASTPLSYQTKNAIFDTLGPAFSYTGASSDIHTVAWSPDGQCFAAGAVCVTDSDSMQYNRPNNLLYGDLEDKVIYELGEHYDQRLKVESGPNSTNAMFATQDSKLFYTVSSVAFSPRGEYMFSAGWDSHFHVWRTAEKGAQPELLSAMRHSAEIDVVTVSCKGQVATAAKKSKNSVKVITIEGWDPDSKEKPTLTSFTSRKARERPDLNILPTALQFEPQFGRMLLAGFSANKQQVDRMDMNGDICLWDVETQEELNVWGSTKSVFDVAFNSRQRDQPLFAVGCVAGMNVNKGTRSVVRFFDGRAHERYTTRLELECPALDMNELKFCPFDENLVASGCTSGSTYVWDIRNPDSWLYELSHGRSLMPLDDEIDWEITDTGVRLLSWGDNATRLYTGSSDGTVKVWDVARSPEDVFVKDIITFNSGVMSGAFSPDHSRLIVGEVDGSVTVLEVSRDDYTLKDTEKLAFIPYDEPEDPHSAPAEQPESGITEAIRLVGNEQIRYAPLGGLPIRQALQGLNYDGPYDQSVEAPYLREQAFEFQLKLAEEPDPQCTIPLCRDGINKITSEDIGDSGRSRDRIPDELRKQWNMIGSNLTVTSGKSKCAECGRPARPLNSTAELRQRILCERCSFDCFRCGTANTIHPETRLLICKTCKCSWEIGALGYQCVKDSGTYNRLTSIASLKKYEEDLLLARGEPQGDATMGDELNALTDYYHSLAIDRPVLPI